MMEPIQEQKEFWERCGFKWEERAIVRLGGAPFDSMGGWRYPNSTVRRDLPPIDLNNLEKYAFPKILEKYDIRMFSFTDDLNDNKIFWFVHLISKETGEVEYANVEGTEELKDALYEVFWEVIKSEG